MSCIPSSAARASARSAGSLEQLQRRPRDAPRCASRARSGAAIQERRRRAPGAVSVRSTAWSSDPARRAVSLRPVDLESAEARGVDARGDRPARASVRRVHVLESALDRFLNVREQPAGGGDRREPSAEAVAVERGDLEVSFQELGRHAGREGVRVARRHRARARRRDAIPSGQTQVLGRERSHEARTRRGVRRGSPTRSCPPPPTPRTRRWTRRGTPPPRRPGDDGDRGDPRVRARRRARWDRRASRV